MVDEQKRKDFFISSTSADRTWAEWIAWQLESEGYTTHLQAWDFRPGENFLRLMDQAIKTTKRTIAVLSPDYLDSKAKFSYEEMLASLVQDPTSQKGKLLPVRVCECAPAGLLAPIIYIDLVNLDAPAARDALLAGVRQSRDLPSVEPLFPGTKPAASTQPVSPSFPGDWPEEWHVPYQRNPFFTGREQLLEAVYRSLFSSQPTALTQAKAISGLGGIGKTQTALEYAYRYGHRYRCVFWVTAATEEDLRTDLAQLATRLELPCQEIAEQQLVDAFKTWLTQQHDWLLILDNADDLAMASKYVPQGNRTRGQVLLLSDIYSCPPTTIIGQ